MIDFITLVLLVYVTYELHKVSHRLGVIQDIVTDYPAMEEIIKKAEENGDTIKFNT